MCVFFDDRFWAQGESVVDTSYTGSSQLVVLSSALEGGGLDICHSYVQHSGSNMINIKQTESKLLQIHQY